VTDSTVPSGPAIPPAGAPADWSGGGDPAGFPPPQDAGGPRRNWLLAAIAVIVTAVLVLAGVMVLRSKSDDTGAASPDGAALNLLEATAKRDPMALTAMIAPAESAGVAQTLQNLEKRAKGSGLQKGGGLNAMSDGTTITTKNVTTKVGAVRDDLAKVTFTGGTMTTDFDPARANPGLRTMAGKSLRAQHKTIDIRRDLATPAADGRDIAPFVMVVKSGGRWYVSPSYTIAEYASQSEQSTGAAAGSGNITTEHFGSPEAAVSGFLKAISDSARTASITPIAKALPAYYGKLIATYPELFRSDEPADASITFSDSAFSRKVVDGTTLVDIKRLRFTATDGDGQRMSGAVDGDCIKLAGQPKQCIDGTMPVGTAGLFGDLADLRGIVTTKDSSGWHVAPEQTLIQSLRLTTGKVSDSEFNRMLGLYLHVPQMALNVAPDATLTGSSAKVTLHDDFGGGLGVAVVGTRVTAGKKVTLNLQSAQDDFASMEVVTADGWVDDGYSGDFGEGYAGSETYGPTDVPTDAFPSDAFPSDFPTDASADDSVMPDDYSVLAGDMGAVSFTPTKSGKANIVIIGAKGATVTVTRGN